MFLVRRSGQAEYFDSPERTAAEVRMHYDWLNRINRLTRFERPFRIWIPRLLGEAGCGQLSVLDVGAGDGELGRALTGWAAGRGWEWRFTDLDLSSHACGMNPNRSKREGSALALPFEDGSFDVVVATTMTHHLGTDEEVIQHFREADRVARRLVLVCDMQRNPVFLVLLGMLLVVKGAPREFRRDGMLSVRRGWRAGEWRGLVERAGLRGAQVWAEHGSRVLLARVKGQGSAAGAG